MSLRQKSAFGKPKNICAHRPFNRTSILSILSGLCSERRIACPNNIVSSCLVVSMPHLVKLLEKFPAFPLPLSILFGKLRQYNQFLYSPQTHLLPHSIICRQAPLFWIPGKTRNMPSFLQMRYWAPPIILQTPEPVRNLFIIEVLNAIRDLFLPLSLVELVSNPGVSAPLETPFEFAVPDRSMLSDISRALSEKSLHIPTSFL